MARLPESIHTSYRLPTGLLAASLTLCYGLIGSSYPAQAAQTIASQSVSSEDISLGQAQANAAGSKVPVLAQVPGGMVPVSPGAPVPWNTTPPWMGAGSGQVPGMPVPNSAGTWVMVWIPYGTGVPAVPPAVGGQVPAAIAYPAGAPFLPPTPPSMPTGGAGIWSAPMATPTAYPQMLGSGGPSGNYYAYPYPSQPYQAQPSPYPPQPYQAQPFPFPSYPPQPYQAQPSPYPSYPPQPYSYQAQPTAYQPQPYSYQPQPYPQTSSYGLPGMPNGSYLPAVPASSLGQPATSLNSFTPSGNQPLSVPGIPVRGSTGSVPPPPAQPLPTIPAIPSVGQPTTLPGYTPPGFFPGGSATPMGQFAPPSGSLSLQEAALPAANTAAAPLVADDSTPLTKPSLNLQGLYVLQRDRSSARARLNGTAFLTPNLLVGGTLDVISGQDLASGDGVQLTELYLATAIPGAPGLRFRLGQLDLTSYFDRNSFAKDISRDFFNPTFNTNPALIAGANSTSSHTGGLVQWAVTDDITLTASAFSSASGVSGFALDGFASEVSFRTGNLILRGTYLTSKDTQFQRTNDRLNAYGVNAEWYIPGTNLGLFGRYGRLNNVNTGLATDTYSLGVNALDLFMENDRLGLAYGRNLSTTAVNGKTPDAVEVFYDFEALPNIRVGFTFQQLNQFTESVAGFRIRGDLDLTPSLSNR